MNKRKKDKIIFVKSAASLKLELYYLQLEQDYELLTLSEAIITDDKNQILKSKKRLKEIHLEIIIVKNALSIKR